MQTNCSIAKAMLCTVEKLILDLNKATLFTSALKEPMRHQTFELQDDLWKNLTQLIENAQNHAKNLEFTLFEEAYSD